MRIDTGRDFGTRECPACAVEVAANENRCPICGYEFPGHPDSRFSRMRWPAAILMLLLILWLIF